MSELCNSSTTPHDSKFLTLFLSNIFFFFLSFILSHPLYFSYFIFFSPYLLKLLSFLSPLFFTTFLLLSLLSLSIHGGNANLESPKHNPGFLLSTFLKISEKLDPKTIQENHEEMLNFEEFEVYKIVFDHHVIREIPIEVSDSDLDCVTKFCTLEHEVSSVIVEERKLGNFLESLEKFENMDKEKKVVDHDHEPPCLKSNKVDGELQKENLVTGSEVNVGKTDNGGEYNSKVMSNTHPKKNGGNDNCENYSLNLDSSRSFGSSYGSMRKEKEWKRTLACKLFEERHNAGGEDGMDSLWETYEKDLSQKDSKNANANVKKKNRKKSEISEFYFDFDKEENDDENEEEEEELISGKICCLQALKMSSGKMNFGMGKNNFVKISKALKGIGWLHHGSRHGKKT